MKLLYFNESEMNILIHALESYLEHFKDITSNKQFKTLNKRSQEFYEHQRLSTDKLLTYVKEENKNE